MPPCSRRLVRAQELFRALNRCHTDLELCDSDPSDSVSARKGIDEGGVILLSDRSLEHGVPVANRYDEVLRSVDPRRETRARANC